MAQDDSKAAGFTDQEKAAMKARAQELAAEKKAGKKRADGEAAVQAAIEAMTGNDKTLATRIHQLISTHAPELWPKTWYGMPAYTKDAKVVCFFQAAGKFEARYATLGFDTAANLDDGPMWATAFALLSIGPAEETRIIELLKKAVGTTR